MNIEKIKQEQVFLTEMYNKNELILQLYEENELLKQTLNNLNQEKENG